MSEDLKQPTRGQLERTLSQQLQKLYREHLGHCTGKITCRLFDDKLTIVVEDSLTQPEQLLLHEMDTQRVEQLRADLDEAVRPKLTGLVEDVLGCKVLDLMSDTTLETGRTGFVIVLSAEGDLSRLTDPQQVRIAQAS